jgi:hypothetical protein
MCKRDLKTPEIGYQTCNIKSGPAAFGRLYQLPLLSTSRTATVQKPIIATVPSWVLENSPWSRQVLDPRQVPQTFPPLTPPHPRAGRVAGCVAAQLARPRGVFGRGAGGHRPQRRAGPAAAAATGTAGAAARAAAGAAVRGGGGSAGGAAARPGGWGGLHSRRGRGRHSSCDGGPVEEGQGLGRVGLEGERGAKGWPIG